MIDFFGPGYEAVELMGYEDRLHEFGQQVAQADYVDADNNVRARLRYGTLEKAMSGKLVSIMRPDLEYLLTEAVGDRADIRYSTVIESIDETSETVVAELSDGTTVEADLLIGADGIHSQTREMKFGSEDKFLYPLGMHTAAFVFDDPEVFDQVNGSLILTESLDAQMGFYGTREGKVAVFTVHRDSGPLPDDPRTVLKERYDGIGPLAQRALDGCPSPSEIYYDVVAQIDLPQWVDGRTMFLGDAAYAVSLVAGQGASLGVAGAYVLGERLRDVTSSEDVPSALRECESRLKDVVRDRKMTARKNAEKVFLPQTMAQLWLRRWMVKAMRVPGASRVLRSGLVGKDHSSVAALSDF